MEKNYNPSQELLDEISILDEAESGSLNLENLPIEIDQADMQSITNDQYIMFRREGFGTSDSSILLGVNPYKNIAQLLREKTSDTISEEEREIGKKTAVRKGKDLEPLIIAKWSVAANKTIIKPTPQYRLKAMPYLKFNFDGVSFVEGRYIPDEIKVVTNSGERNYDISKATYMEDFGFFPIKEDVTMYPWSIEKKAEHYGIPPYYYTQLQQQILGLDAPYGYLAVIFDRTWKVYAFFVHRDNSVINMILTEAPKAWVKRNQILRMKELGESGIY